MTTILKGGGMQHAYSLGNIESFSKPGNRSSRNCDSEDENTGRKKTRSTSSYPKPSVYSKADIQEQYCLSERQLQSVERSRFFGCFSSHNNSQSFLSVCVGRRNPSDENLADSAPFYKYPRYANAVNRQEQGIMGNGDDTESSYFRRKPTSFLCSNDPKRFTWMKDGEQQLDNAPNTPFIIDSHLNTFTHRAGSFRCPSHSGVTSSILSGGDSNAAPRTKHVSFARSHTLTSFDEVSVGSLARSTSRLNTAKSQERLIGGKKVTNSPEPQSRFFNSNNQPIIETNRIKTANNFGTNISNSPSEAAIIEKLKRNVKKTQATQTDVLSGRRSSMRSNMSSTSPRSSQRYSVMSQESSINGNFISRKLMKSLSEATTRHREDINGERIVPEILRSHQFHETLFRTHSAEPPRSPRDMNESVHSNPAYMNYDMFSRGSSRISDLETQGSVTSGRCTTTKASEESLPFSINESYIDANILNHNSCIDFIDYATLLPVEYNSLPRRKCSYHANDYRTNSLPRKNTDHRSFIHQKERDDDEDDDDDDDDEDEEEEEEEEEIPIPKCNLAHLKTHGTFSLESKTGSKPTVAEINHRRFSCGIQDAISHLSESDFENLQQMVRRNSVNTFYCNRQQSDDEEEESETDEYCSTCSSESESKEEEEIFIDFKPSVSPIQKRMSKSLYDDESFDQQPESANDDTVITSTSEDDLRLRHETSMLNMHTYSNVPIRHDDHLLKLPGERDVNANNRREAFRNRSISLDKNAGEVTESDEYHKHMKSGPPSPRLDDKIKNISTYPSADSLSTRDHSDGNWNESQATVLQLESGETVPSLSSSTLKRKTATLQHQHSSVDIEALEVEDHFVDQASLKSATSQTSINNNKTLTIQSKAPSIAVIPSISMEAEELEVLATHRKSIPCVSLSNRQNIRRKSAEPMVHVYSNIKHEMLHSVVPISKSSSDQQPFKCGSDFNKNATDVSEGSTNTDEYMTCTEASKRGIMPTTASSSSTTQVPVPTQSSQTLTQNGSSFESASSIYSLARVENISEDAQVPIAEDTLSLPMAPARKPSPSHSISSSSSGSYFNGKNPMKSTSPRNSVVIPSAGTVTSVIMKQDLASDGDKSEKRHSSSGYYESPHEDDSCRPRRQRDWNEDERRKRKEKMRLEVCTAKPSTSPTKKTGICFKRISADDRAALHVLDGTSHTKSKRNRPKTRRSPRARNNNEDPFVRKSRTPGASPEGLSTDGTSSRYVQQVPQISPKKHGEPSPEKRLMALSTESLRSVSPGSDSVFYSEADVHCHHCGKEVEIITALGDDVDDPYFAQDEDQANIVKPPADFADSPNGIRSCHRIYKKMDKRLRSEDRHGERKHYRNRQSSTRAKSEERGKDDMPVQQPIRPAGSTPCVGANSSFNVRDNNADPEQGIYHGLYRLGMWICIADRDVWRRQDLIHDQERPRDLNDRRPSTESEKDFRKKYQAITHRLVHRKSCVEMYRRQANNSFSTDKSIIVRRESGEFGFRIHGSKPVVVSAIEPETPAETSGLEIGDIILSVNGVSVIEKSHSEVVKIAHAGSDVLELEVARTIGLLTNETLEAPNPSLYSGFLWRKGNNNANLSISHQKWVRRWFCLRTDHCLYYYKNDQDAQPIGAVLLTNHSIENCSADIGRSFAFRITSSESISTYLAAETEEAANRWIAVMSHASKQNDQWLDISTRNLRLPPSSVPRPDCFGYLLLQGNKWRAWSKRYCVLKDACLYFYLDGSSKNALGMACLQGYKVQPASNVVGKKFSFEITPPEPKLRHYYFSTDSDMDKKRWIAALEYSIDRWMKTL